ncbi:MAG: RsmD family RNA methyltransferase [Candidatus Dojkabacteria bacterium]|nr:RsmD family RNA methyltransferase [Candidatus Dojkabacteria bacterium]
MKKLQVSTGIFKKRKILVPNTARPFTSKIKKFIFDIIQNLDTPKNSLVDIFSGGGSIGIEAISNNFTKITFVDNNYLAKTIITKNLNNMFTQQYESLKNKIEVKICIQDYKQFVLAEKYLYDFVVVDPPFTISSDVKYPIFKSIMHNNSVLIVRSPIKNQNILEKLFQEHFKITKFKKIGNSTIFFLQKQ